MGAGGVLWIGPPSAGAVRNATLHPSQGPCGLRLTTAEASGRRRAGSAARRGKEPKASPGRAGASS